MLSAFNIHFDINGWDDVWKVFNKSWSEQCLLFLKVGIIFLLNTVWYVRNCYIFKNKFVSVSSFISSILSACFVADNNAKVVSHLNMHDSFLLKFFKVVIKPPKAPRIIEVLWKPPSRIWIKINCDGASLNNPSVSACVGIIRNHDRNCVGAFAHFLSLSNSLIAELSGDMSTIKFANEQGWHNLWLKSDSITMVHTFKLHFLVSWQIHNRWFNCVNITSMISFIVSLFFKKGIVGHIPLLT